VICSAYPRNYYAVLRVPEDADPAAIRHAYRVLAHRYHPDTGSGSSPRSSETRWKPTTFLATQNDGISTILIWRGAAHIHMYDLSR
jgi:hypothetical protein